MLLHEGGHGLVSGTPCTEQRRAGRRSETLCASGYSTKPRSLAISGDSLSLAAVHRVYRASVGIDQVEQLGVGKLRRLKGPCSAVHLVLDQIEL